MDKFEKAIVQLLVDELPLPAEEIEQLLEKPKNKEMGDYAFPCFVLTKILRDDPVRIAAELKQKLKGHKLVKAVENRGPYINFFISREYIVKETLEAVASLKDKYGAGAQKGRALVEHTSTNPNASPHVGRARNSLLGDSLARILKFAGYKTEAHFYVNDVGKQIAMLVYGSGKKKPAFSELLKLYIDTNKKVEQDPALEKKIFELLSKLEKGDSETKKRFREIVETCIKGQSTILSEIGIKFDSFDYESDYLWGGETKEILGKLKKAGKVFVDEEGRNVLDLKGFDLAMKSPVFVLTRADGTTLYGLRDIAYTMHKLELAKDRNIVVLGEDHKLYFEELSAALQLLGCKAPEVLHYSFVLLNDGKMSTRYGTVVLLEEFMSEAVEKARQEIRKRNPEMKSAELEKLARVIGYGALKYSILKVSPEKNVSFDWEQALSFEGDAAPYIQYAYARIRSILRKRGKSQANADYAELKEDSELELVQMISEFPQKAEDASQMLKPHVIAGYAYLLAEKFNGFYHQHSVLQADGEKRSRRGLL